MTTRGVDPKIKRFIAIWVILGIGIAIGFFIGAAYQASRPFIYFPGRLNSGE